MIKYGCMALIAMACSTVVPAAQAKGGFFVGGQAGEATYDDSGLDEDSAGTQAFSGGYRWQAGAITQVGFEAGFGKVDEITQDYSFDGGSYTQNDRIGMDADYRLIGANARFNFGRDSRWFAIGRGGYMDYEQNSSFQSATYVDGVQVFGYNDSVSDNGGGAYFGAGVGMDVTPNFNVNLMFNSYAYTSYDDGYTDEVSSATATTLGIEVRF